MTNEIKEILDSPKILMLSYGNYISLNDYVKLKDYITNLQEELNYQKQAEQEYNEKHTKLMKKYKELQEENKRLKELYRRTCNHLFNIGNDELARYFQAQISECNTFTPQGEYNENN